MLRKLIALAITSGLAKKAWDKYHEKNAAPAADAGKPARKTARPAARRRKATEKA
jgi:hypothetical protein